MKCQFYCDILKLLQRQKDCFQWGKNHILDGQEVPLWSPLVIEHSVQSLTSSKVKRNIRKYVCVRGQHYSGISPLE